MFDSSRIARAVALACGSLATSAVMAQQPAPASQLERVEITGSSIKRTQAEGPAPVEIYNRRDIERSGATSINELIRSIPSIDVFDQGELASNSPAGSGTANLALRGLGSTQLLILLNGRRLPLNALYDSSGAGAAVDVNMIPISAIERVEILKDGGSAIYGADAVAGVINFITKRDYAGIEARAGYGVSSRNDGKETTAGLAFGFGDLDTQRFNVLLALDYFKRDPILRKDRDISRTVDGRRFGAPDGRSSFAPTGNVLDPVSGNFAGLTYKPCAPEDFNIVCRYDFNASVLTAYNGADRLSGLALASFQVTPDIRAFTEIMLARTEDQFDAHPVPDFFNVPIIDPAQAAFEDPSVPGTVVIAGRFMQGGPRITKRRSDLMNIVAGAEGTSFGLDWKAAVGQGVSEVTNRDSNYYNRTLWNAATVSGQLDPTVFTNDPAFVQSLKVNPVREGESTVRYINAQVGGTAMQLPAGPLQYAVGTSLWKEELVDTPDALSQQGLVVGSIGQAAVDASRNAKALFGELSVPIFKTLEAQLAVRYDNYPEASQTSPKVALRWQALPNLMLRGSYTESFKAPALKQLFGAQEQGAITIVDAASCQILIGNPVCALNAFQVNGSNPDLKPEKGQTINLGVVADAGILSGSIDFWRIDKEDGILAPTTETAIANGLFGRDPAQPSRFLVFTNLQNVAGQMSSGFDFDGRARFGKTPIGNLSLRNLFTYYTHVKTRNPGEDWAEFNGVYGTIPAPRWRNTFQLTSEADAWTTQVALRSTAGFWDQGQSYPILPGTNKVGTHEEVDLQVQYTGFKSLRLVGGVKNLFDDMPPFSVTNLTDNANSQMGFAELYSNRGRFFYVNVVYQFR
jgi:iron complex outermembrane recepter protein